MKKEPKTPLHAQVAEKLIEQLKAGTAPWEMPWDSDGAMASQLPYNEMTGKRYRGINVFSLMFAGRKDPRWLTFKQAESRGYQILQGEKGTRVQFIKTHDKRPKRDENGKPVLDENGKPVKVTVVLDRPIISTAWVFNGEQIEGMPPLKTSKDFSLNWNPQDAIEQLVVDAKVNLEHHFGNEAYYALSQDKIRLPLKEQFSSADRYYATLLHEMGHWTGHKDRLDRTLMNSFGTPEYAREELRAEIASMLMGTELHIGHDPGQHVAYVKDWISILENNPYEIHLACADAEKICTYLTGVSPMLKKELGEEAAPQIQSVQSKTPRYLSTGDEMEHNGNHYKVLGHLKQGRLRMEETGSGNHFSLSRTDGLYASLLAIKQSQLGQSLQEPVSEQQIPHYQFNR